MVFRQGFRILAAVILFLWPFFPVGPVFPPLPAHAADMQCVMEEAPAITVRVETAEITYDFSKTARELTAIKADGASPYPADVDAVSGGMRKDTPRIASRIGWTIIHEPVQDMACIGYNDIDVTISLKPEIFVAREFRRGACREAILQHERKHVEVDQQVMNRAATAIGSALQAHVRRKAVYGPFPAQDRDQVQTISAQAIEKILNAQISLMEQDMHKAQKEVDTLEEYTHVTGFCRDVDFPR